MFLTIAPLSLLLALTGLWIAWKGFGRNPGVLLACLGMSIVGFSLFEQEISRDITGYVIHVLCVAGAVWICALSPWAKKLYTAPGSRVKGSIRLLGAAICLAGLFCLFFGPGGKGLRTLLAGMQKPTAHSLARRLGMGPEEGLSHLYYWPHSPERSAILREELAGIKEKYERDASCALILPELYRDSLEENNLEDARFLFESYDTICSGYMTFLTRKLRQAVDDCDPDILARAAASGISASLPIQYKHGEDWVESTIAAYALLRECKSGMALFPLSSEDL